VCCVVLCGCGVRHRVGNSLSVTHAWKGKGRKGGVDCSVYRRRYSTELSAVCSVPYCVMHCVEQDGNERKE
jgi:hypothetical protein